MRTSINLNRDWEFIKRDVGLDEALLTDGESIDLPHTWNAADGQDGGNDYYRGKCWYVKEFAAPKIKDERVFLEFKGVNASAEVFLNGKPVISHEGGYSTFRKDITEQLQNENFLVVSVDNSVSETVYPQKADFTFYGGIYRDVNLLIVPKHHFDLSFHGAPGIRVTPTVNGANGEVVIEGYAKGGEILTAVYDREGNAVARGYNGQTLVVEDIHLWNGVEDPYLYRAVVRLFVDGKFIDEVETNFGFRTYSVDPEKGFFLNGKSYPLRGVSRHQDRPKKGNAISKEDMEEDVELMLEMGANTVRLAHYQHDDYFYDLCDKYGLVVWAEIPFISSYLDKGDDNVYSQMTELVYQQYNHPSIFFWGLSNEITMYPMNAEKKARLVDVHKKLNELCKTIDPTRLTTMACFMLLSPKDEIAGITDVISWNLYFGWYTPGLFLNKGWFDRAHRAKKDRCFGLSEYGAEGMPNLHSDKPKRGDNSEEYQALYHEYMAKAIAEMPYLWATHVWNMFDFAADGRNQGGEPGMNHKGLVTFDRKIKKDAFYLYKAYWSKESFVHICSKRFVHRTGKTLKIKVYSNQEKVSLFLNGALVEEKTGDKVFEFTVPLSARNEVEVRSGNLKDNATFIKVDKPDPSYKVDPGKNVSWQF